MDGPVTSLVACLQASEVFPQVEDAVDLWDRRDCCGLEKKGAVVAELVSRDIHCKNWILDTLIQLALLKRRIQ